MCACVAFAMHFRSALVAHEVNSFEEFLVNLLSLKNSLRTRKLSKILSGQLFPHWFQIKSYKIGDTSFELSLRYRLYNA